MTSKVWTQPIVVSVLQVHIVQVKEWILQHHVLWVVSVQKDHKNINCVLQEHIILILEQQTLETVLLAMLADIVLTWDKLLWIM